jgi:hypothetical protein
VTGSFEDTDELSFIDERPKKRFRTVLNEDGVETVDLT